MAGETHRPRLRASKELVARVTSGSEPMRERPRQQRIDVAELRRRRDQLAPVGRTVERLWPSFVPPVGDVSCATPRLALDALMLLCGVCDEVLVEDASPDLAPVLRCPCCQAYNVRRSRDLL